MNEQGDSPVKTEIEGVIRQFAGKRDGGYAVVYPFPHCGFDIEETAEGMKVAPITFEIKDWQGDHAPEINQWVVLSDIEKFSHGWRARRARPVKFQSGNDVTERK